MFLGYLLFGFDLNYVDASKAKLITLIKTVLAVFGNWLDRCGFSLIMFIDLDTQTSTSNISCKISLVPR